MTRSGPEASCRQGMELGQRDNMSKSKVAVEIEDTATWPRRLYKTAMASRDVLVAYHLEMKRIDRLCEDDVFLRVNPPTNPHAAAYSTLITELESLLAGCSIVGYHCTRLTQNELQDIRQNGLQLLSPALLESRLRSAYHQGLLTPKQYEYLTTHPQIRSNLANENGNRTGMTFFCPNRSTLADPPSVYRLFRSWGGEAFYCGLEGDSFVSMTIRSIGKPCLVKCQIPVREMRPSYPCLAARLASFLVIADVDFPEPSFQFDLSIKRNLAAAEVEEIIEAGLDSFESLTRCGSWPERYGIHYGG